MVLMLLVPWCIDGCIICNYGSYWKPIKSLSTFIQSGFNKEASDKIMAETDSNIREGFRGALNKIDFLDIIPDQGWFGTLGLYGKDAVNAADAKMRGEGEVKNASGGSYFLDLLTLDHSKVVKQVVNL